MKSKHVTIDDFPVHLNLSVLWGHMDAFQHVNNVIYFRYFESARIEYFRVTGLMEQMMRSGVGPILAATSCRYIRPLTFPDTIKIGCRTKWIDESELEQEYGIFSNEQQKIVAIGTGLIVAYDYKKQERSKFPREFILSLERVDPDVETRVEV